MIIDGILPRTCSHLPRAHTQRVEKCPKAFDALPISTSGPLDEVERIRKLTASSMSPQVHFRYDKGRVPELLGGELHTSG